MLLSDAFMRAALPIEITRQLGIRTRRWPLPVARLAGILSLLGWVFGIHAPILGQEEVRALWVVRTTLTSPSTIETMVNAAKASGFNSLLVQIRGRGDAYYQGGREPRPASLAADRLFDPLAVTITRAHRVGLQVHAWVNVNLVSSATDLPVAGDHLIYRHPEWLMVPRALVPDLAGIDPRSPEYLGRLTRHVRTRTDVEGLYASPIASAAVDHTVSVVRDIAERYDLDGVHFDYIRYPAADFDYSRDTLQAFRAAMAGELDAADRRRFDARIAQEPLVYTDAFPDKWRAFRADAVTALLARLKQAVKSVRPTARVSAAVGPDPIDASTRRFQNWREWLQRGLLDAVCPMAYTTDSATFAAQVAAVRDLAGGRPIWAGIGAYRLSRAQIVENVQAARRLGAGGVVLFSYDSFIDAPRGLGELAEVGHAAFSNR
jgi:uncharacterized lipoprotein YddW (UPF0748 family)